MVFICRDMNAISTLWQKNSVFFCCKINISSLSLFIPKRISTLHEGYVLMRQKLYQQLLNLLSLTITLLEKAPFIPI